MDLSVLSVPASEYSKQRTGVPFTVRSASSPSYRLTRRPGFRKQAGISQEVKRTTKEDEESQPCRKEESSYFFTHSGIKKEDHTIPWSQRTRDTGQCKEETSGHNIFTKVSQNDATQRTSTVSTFDRNGIYNRVCERQGRTEWRSHNLPSRSKSLEWGKGRSGPVKVDPPVLSSKPGCFISKEAESIEERRPGDRVNCTMGGLVPSVKTYDPPLTYQSLGRVSRGHSLPSRLRPQVNSLGVPGGQSISERIEKLYGSAGLCRTDNSNRMRNSTTGTDQSLLEQDGQTTTSYCRGRPTNVDISPISRQKRSLSYERTSGGTFPRYYSKGDKASTSPVQSRISFLTTHKDINSSGPGSSVSLGATERAPVGQWQGYNQGKHPEEGETYWDRKGLNTGTRSLDRARSKFTVAAQIRATRAAEGVNGPLQSSSYLERRSNSFREPSEFREISKDVMKDDEEKGRKLQERHAHEILKSESATNTNDVIQEEQKKEDLNTEEDVFESNAHKVTLKTTENKLFPELWAFPSAASVRNKINQFEALTQRATGQLPMPIRSFSVPAQFTVTHDGVKKSASVKALGGLREKCDALKESGEACNKPDMNATTKEKKFESEKVEDEIKSDTQAEDKEAEREPKLNSVDKVELGLENQERRENNIKDKEEKKIKSDNDFVDDLGNYSRLNDTCEIPPDGGAESQSNEHAIIDEPDFFRVSSPEEPNDRDVSTKSSPSSFHDASTSLLLYPEVFGDQKIPPSGNMSPVSDGDTTPTNPPNESPFLFNSAQPKNTLVVAESKTESTPDLTDEDNTTEEDLPLPLASSSDKNFPDVFCPIVSTPSVDREEQDAHISVWVAGLNSKIKSWKYEDDDDDDDSTQKDEDSNYDSDSAESSVTITSTTSHSDRKSFCVSLADLYNFAGTDYESENDSDEWRSTSRRSASLSSDMSALSYVSVLSTGELDRLLEDVRGLEDSTLDCDDVQVVVLHKEMGVGLGFSLAGGVDQNKPITVHKVFRTGVAAQEGSIKEGAQVLSINGTVLCGYAHWEALRILRRTKTRELGVVVLRRGEVCHTPKKGAEANNLEPVQAQFLGTGRHVYLRLEKNDRDLGFSLEGGVGSSLGNRPLIVQKIFLGGPVDKVCPGDEVLEIQGVNVVGMRRLEAWAFIRRLPPGPVDVVLHRPFKRSEQ
ncbi:uncharacterized protein si:dkey-92i15.4 isoform X2 [Thalassophryne amazonica]|uniref:uncharacterized protein si:dkey-92i15.4 isoform X2 n=1 Tax=Thalassophryne amazonica TaxID=390379 RepID=UPI001470A870|nr:uncharacterized protein si:dkey-92i15.4 isoform X2 [Thalassophryne amazonica]XP_034030681.1 uncharacterized protein si:dkey-92i15.4 isoform X2 [Thalassophryne amazonica]XP_034030682.1 uncharacterized protein si:dkey-92i15.4 isoform X2 [Thalassophryne amazonica]